VVLGDEEAIIEELGTKAKEKRGVYESNPQPPASIPPVLPLKEVSQRAAMEAEKEAILMILGKTNWNRKRTAELLRISYKALLYKIKQYGLTR
jgi:two-component system response regulator AtoC